MRELEREGFEVTYMDVGKDGLFNLERFGQSHASRYYLGFRDGRQQ